MDYIILLTHLIVTELVNIFNLVLHLFLEFNYIKNGLLIFPSLYVIIIRQLKTIKF